MAQKNGLSYNFLLNTLFQRDPFSVSVLDRSSIVLRYFFVRPSFHLRSVAVPEAECNEEVTELEQTKKQATAKKFA